MMFKAKLWSSLVRGVEPSITAMFSISMLRMFALDGLNTMSAKILISRSTKVRVNVQG